MRSQTRLSTSVDRPVNIFFDASVRRDSESTAIGFVIETADGKMLATKGMPTKFMPNTQAEYFALLKALQTASNYPGIEHVRVHGDCKSVIDVLDPKKTDNPNYTDIAELVKNARGLLAQFSHVELRYISRKKNRRADKLAYVGHEERVTTLPKPPKRRVSLPPSRQSSRSGQPAGD